MRSMECYQRKQKAHVEMRIFAQLGVVFLSGKMKSEKGVAKNEGHAILSLAEDAPAYSTGHDPPPLSRVLSPSLIFPHWLVLKVADRLTAVVFYRDRCGSRQRMS